MPPSSVGIAYNGTFVRIPLVTPHASRWIKSTDENPGTELSSHENALVSSGIILQVPHSWDPQCSCLFAELFTGDMHALGVVRQELHRTLRIRTPAGLAAKDIFRGVLLTVSMLPGPGGKLTPQLRKPETFRINYGGGKSQLLTVQ